MGFGRARDIQSERRNYRSERFEFCGVAELDTGLECSAMKITRRDQLAKLRELFVELRLAFSNGKGSDPSDPSCDGSHRSQVLRQADHDVAAGTDFTVRDAPRDGRMGRMREGSC